MIKAKKGLLIALFAAMMVFAFGATSAFAVEDQPTAPDKVVWGVDGTSATVTYGDKSASLDNATFERNWLNGVVTSTVKYGESVNPEALGEVEKKAYDYVENGGVIQYHYLDFDFAKVTNANDYSTYTYAQFYNGTSRTVDPETGVISGQGIDVYLSAPTYVKNYEAVKGQKRALGTILGTGLYTTIYATGFTADNYADMPVTLSATVFPADGAFEGDYMPSIGTLKDNNIVVKGMVPAADQVKFGVDDLENAGAFPTSANYDGKEHTIVASEVPGFSVAYQVWNTTTKVWEDTKAVTFKDAGSIIVRYNVYETAKGVAAGAWYKKTLTVNKSENHPDMYFTTDSAVTWTFVKDQYDPWEYVEIHNALNDADADALLAYYKAAYTIKETSRSKFDETAYRWTFEAVTPAPKKSDFAVLANYGDPTPAWDAQNVTILDVAPNYDYEVEFTNTPTLVTYKAKTLKKKAKSFTVTATAANGVTLKYKLINAPKKIVIDKFSGKVTLQKGLKKGTYKIKVKAYVPGVNDILGTASETQAIKIKVK